MNNSDLTKMIEDSFDTALKSRGIANILVAGKTGVGKSTLINAIFDGEFAKTGSGKPITKNTRQIKKEGIPITIWDTRGLELNDFDNTLKELEKKIEEQNSKTDSNEHIHLAWICIAEGSRRVEDAEINLMKSLEAKKVKTIVVITKAQSDEGFRNKVQDLLPDAVNVCRVNSLPTNLDDGHVIPPKGLSELVDISLEVIPSAQKAAFIASQKISLKHKVNKSHVIVASSATAAAAAGASPIPFSDAFILIPIHISMITGITLSFGVKLEKAFLYSFVTSTIAAGAGTLAGRTIAANLIKFIPGGGTLVGGVISGGTASLLTVTIGETYIAVLKKFAEEDRLSDITGEEIISAFKSNFKL